MQILSDRNGHLYAMRIADVTVGGNHHRAGSGSFGNAGDQE